MALPAARAASEWQGAGNGSNNRALGHAVDQGSALLCNDPHLRLALPSTFYLMHLRAETRPRIMRPGALRSPACLISNLATIDTSLGV